MVPETETDVLLLSITIAEGLASAGKVAEGHACLLAALGRAEDLADEGESWAEELVRRYRAEIDHYTATYELLRDPQS
jgi:hypothetical protein